MDQIDENAGLYALGMLDEVQSAQVREHIEQCAPCKALVRNSQRVVAQLSEQVPLRGPSGGLRDRIVGSMRRDKPARASQYAFAGGALAGLLAAALVLIPGRISLQTAVNSDDRALSALVQSHFNHVPFTAVAPGAPSAKVLYGRHGEWLYVVVHNPPPGLQVQIQTGSGARDLGALHRSGGNGTLFVQVPGRIEQVVLLDDGVAVARAVPAGSP